MAVRKKKTAAAAAPAAPEPDVEDATPVLPITRNKTRTEPCPHCGQVAFLDDGGDGAICSGCGKRS